ncbi:MAG: hypothetical protein PV358_07195 [Acidimicrobiales bacterium]|nr:hypothetical protein [Acidimicrobiales bacterium]
MDVMTRHAVAAPAPEPAPGAGPPLRWSPAWALEPAGTEADLALGRDTTVVLSAGADRRVAIDGVDAAQRAAIERWSAGAAVTAGAPDGGRDEDCCHGHSHGDSGQGDGGDDDGDTDCGGRGRASGDGVEETGSRHQAVARLLDRLVELGVVVPRAATAPPTVVADDAVTAGDLGDLLTEGGVGGMLVLVRTGARWPAVPPRRLHLGVDLSLHHTVVLGPLVIPGASACLACLDARVARRWSAPTVPPEPAVRRRLPVVAALLDVQLALVAAGTSPLVNATVAWNLETGTTDRQSLYKLAGCPLCDTGPGDGRVALPWGAAP